MSKLQKMKERNNTEKQLERSRYLESIPKEKLKKELDFSQSSIDNITEILKWKKLLLRSTQRDHNRALLFISESIIQIEKEKKSIEYWKESLSREIEKREKCLTILNGTV